jgi:hypothetical protein
MPASGCRVLVAALAAAVTVVALQRAAERSAGGAPRRPGQAHNPLELWNVAGVRLELGLAEHSGTSIAANVTAIRGQHEWVEVVWSGLPFGELAAARAPAQLLPIFFSIFATVAACSRHLPVPCCPHSTACFTPTHPPARSPTHPPTYPTIQAAMTITSPSSLRQQTRCSQLPSSIAGPPQHPPTSP